MARTEERPDHDRPTSGSAGADASDAKNGTPRWVKVFLAVSVIVVVVVIIVLAGQGGHGPGRHAERGTSEASAAFQPPQ